MFSIVKLDSNEGIDVANANIRGNINVEGNIKASNFPPPGICWDTGLPTTTNSNNNRWYGVAWSNVLNLFAAVAYGGSPTIMTSSDGYNWSSIASVTGSLNCICWSYDQRKFVAAGSNKTYISTDGINWTQYTNSVNINGIIWVSNLQKYIGCGTNNIYLSNDGISFTNIDVSSLNAGYTYYRIAYSSILNRLVAVGFSGSNGAVIYSNNNGNSWQNATIPLTTVPWRAIAYSEKQNKFVALAGLAASSLRTMTSSDGVNWALYFDGGGDCNWHEVLYLNKYDMWVGIGPGSLNHCMISPNGQVWTLGFAPRPGAQNAGAYSPELDRIVSVGDGYGYPWIMVSPALYGKAPYK